MNQIRARRRVMGSLFFPQSSTVNPHTSPKMFRHMPIGVEMGGGSGGHGLC